jgi:pyrroline-5-carboxylate reductase
LVERVGIIGVGHLASYLVEGLRRAAPDLEIILSRHLGTHTETLEAEFGATPGDDNQAVADAAEVVVVSTRPADLLGALRSVVFQTHHVVISTAVGVPLASVLEAVGPGLAIRALPLTCSAINRSPTLLFPDQPEARALFERLGTVLAIQDEAQFTRAGAISAYYGWVYALLDEALSWTVRAGIDPEVARTLVLETTRGATEMGLAHPDRELAGLLDSLATPGGITRDGLEVLRKRESLEAWVEALDVVVRRLER